jgi:hypothetical protein
MLRRLSIAVATCILGIAPLFLAARLPAEEPPTPLAVSSDALKWNLDRLSKDPFKLIKATPDAERGQVRVVLEFSRVPSLTELYDWERAGGPVVFRFLDEDGVVLRSVVPKLDGEMVRKSGARFRLLLPLPDEKILAATRSVVAE